MSRLLFSVLVVLFVVYKNEGKVYDRCTLARELKTKGIPQDQVDNFVCLVENNSFDTEWTGGPYEDGTKNFGIFQINNKDWCVIGKPGGFCFTDCNDYNDDDITDDFMCAKEVHRRFGFDPFWVWTQKCRPAGPDLSYCLTEGNTTTVASVVSKDGNTGDGVKDGSTERSTTEKSTTENNTSEGSKTEDDEEDEEDSTDECAGGGNFVDDVEATMYHVTKDLLDLRVKFNHEISKLLQKVYDIRLRRSENPNKSKPVNCKIKF